MIAFINEFRPEVANKMSRWHLIHNNSTKQWISIIYCSVDTHMCTCVTFVEYSSICIRDEIVTVWWAVVLNFYSYSTNLAQRKLRLTNLERPLHNLLPNSAVAYATNPFAATYLGANFTTLTTQGEDSRNSFKLESAGVSSGLPTRCKQGCQQTITRGSCSRKQGCGRIKLQKRGRKFTFVRFVLRSSTLIKVQFAAALLLLKTHIHQN